MSTLPAIKTLDQLLKTIHTGPGYESTGHMLKQIDFGIEEVADKCVWDASGYAKVSLEKTDTYELMLICWEKGQESPIHDHAEQQGWIYVIQGELLEELYYKDDESGPLELKSTERITPDDVSYVNDSIGIHRIKNMANGRTVSLHYHTSPISHVNVYDELSGEFTPYKLH